MVTAREAAQRCMRAANWPLLPLSLLPPIGICISKGAEASATLTDYAQGFYSEIVNSYKICIYIV